MTPAEPAKDGKDIELSVLKRKRFSTVHLARVSDMQSTVNPSALGSRAKCEGSYVNEGVEAFQRMRGYRVDMFSRTL